MKHQSNIIKLQMYLDKINNQNSIGTDNTNNKKKNNK